MRTLKGFVLCSLLVFPLFAIARKTSPALELIQRVSGSPTVPVKLSIKQNGEHTAFEYKVEDGVLKIKGTDPVALCRGFYDYVKSNHMGLYSWSGNNIQLPEELVDQPLKRVVSPFQNHYYFNVVTYGYSMPYWDWERWEKELDWMALHGVNMPLALVANEAISARVWAKLGLTKAEIDNYFVGPAHLPWMRMGNISGIDGPLTDEWHESQIVLQHRILKRMRELGMKPICPAFAGFIPKAFLRIYPNLKVTETTWAGAFHNWMLSPEEELFHTIGKLFIEEWEKEFGKNDYYLADSFNEMDVPFPPKDDPKRYELLASYGERVYQSIKAGNRDAVWVMQGWMFGYMRHIWDYHTLEALVSRVPYEKMLLLDLAVDYNRHFWHSQVNWDFYKGFYNKPWVYSVIPNMGGKNGMTGVLEFYANGHWDALRSPNKGNLVAFGMAPEGIENNEVIYELLSDAGWAEEEIHLQEWLKGYSLCRYGDYPQAIATFWNQMLKSVYGTFTDDPRYVWQFRPSVRGKGSINTSADFYNGIEQLINLPESLKESELLNYDLVQWTAAYVGAKAEQLVAQIEQAYAVQDWAEASALEQTFESLMLRMDALLSAFPTTSMQTWTDRARACGSSAVDADAYESNARRIVTIWGPPVDDYSARIWGGLIRDYYLPRWKAYFQQLRSGEKFDFTRWENNWVARLHGLSPVQIPKDLHEAALELLRDARDITMYGVSERQQNVLAHWKGTDFADASDWVEFSWAISTEQTRGLRRLRFCNRKGSTTIGDVSIWADGVRVMEYQTIGTADPELVCPFSCATPIVGNNSLVLKVRMKADTHNNAEGFVELKY